MRKSTNTNPENHWGDGSGAGIYIGGEGSCAPTISNNFIVNNAVGIALESDTSVLPSTVGYQKSVIVNNTISRNGIFQIWSGDRTHLTMPPPNVNDNLNYGRAMPLIYNNILDAPGGSTTSFPPTYPLACCGIHWDDMIVTQYTLAGGSAQALGVNFNAFQLGSVWEEVISAANYQTRYTIPNNSTITWPLSAIQFTTTALGAPTFSNANVTPPVQVIGRVGSLPPPPPATAFVPRVDITGWTPALPAGTGTLYISDVFRNYLDTATGTARCQHDYRLSPMVRTPAGVSSNNPLVGMGINVSLDGSPNSAGNVMFSFSFGATNYSGGLRTIGGPQGIPGNLLDYPSASKHEWDWDADGWGNPRITVFLGFNPGSAYGDVDLGADEVDNLIMSGYLNSTRIFSRTHTVGTITVPFTIDCQNPYYFGVAGTQFLRPQFTFWEGLVEEWYKHIDYPGLSAGDKNWVHGVLMPLAIWTNTSPTGATFPYRYQSIWNLPTRQPGVPRSQWCDYGSLLLPDPKAWGFVMAVAVPWPVIGPYGSHPWYNNQDPSAGPGGSRDDNQHAYWYPYGSNPTAPASNNYNIQFSQPFAGMVSPPGTMENNVSITSPTPPPWIPPSWNGSHLDLITFLNLLILNIPFGHWSSPGASTTFDSWGVGDSGQDGTTQDMVPSNPSKPWYGIRINCEAADADATNPRTNLQTFLIVQGGAIDIGVGSGSGGSSGSSKSTTKVPAFKVPGPDPENARKANAIIQKYMQSAELKKALEARKAKIDQMRNSTK